VLGPSSDESQAARIIIICVFFFSSVHRRRRVASGFENSRVCSRYVRTAQNRIIAIIVVIVVIIIIIVMIEPTFPLLISLACFLLLVVSFSLNGIIDSLDTGQSAE
jgi:hypothetical protein